MDYIAWGKKIYDLHNIREFRRFCVFVLRCRMNRGRMRQIDEFFHRVPLLAEAAEAFPFFYEQPTRSFFYYRSTFDERAAIVESHLGFLADRLRPETFGAIYRGKNIPLWEGGEIDGKRLKLMLYYEPGQRKEGLLSVMLRLDNAPLYQIIFWIAPNAAGEPSMWIGAMQGPNMKDAREIVKQVTKLCHAYRTKNLILYASQAVARALGLLRIYAVTNEGYYANNHLRADRKLKTDFSDFWHEAGGRGTDDSRFDELPLIEQRKTMDEVPTRKRAVYKRRFAMLDELDASVAARMREVMR